MINRINPGSVLPFYNNLNNQAHKFYWNAGWLIPLDNRYLIPFQFRVNGSVSAVTQFQLIGATTINLNTNLITLTADQDVTYVTFNGGDTGTAHPCGEYYIKVQIDSSINVYSDRVILKNFLNDTDAERWWKLSYKPSLTRLHNMYFGAVFTPSVYLEGWMDYPEIEREEVIEVNQAGYQVLNTAYTKERQILVTEALPNQLRYTLSLVRELSTGTCTLQNLKNTDILAQCAESTFLFTNAGNEYYTSARFQFTTHRDFVNACGIDISGYVAFGEIENGSIVFGEEVDGGVIFGYLQ